MIFKKWNAYVWMVFMFLAAASSLSLLLLLGYKEEFQGTLLPELIGFCLEGAVFVGIFNLVLQHRERKSKVYALESVAYPVAMVLEKFCGLLFHLKKASSEVSDGNSEMAMSDFLKTYPVEQLQRVNLNNRAPVAPTTAGSISWLEYMVSKARYLKADLDKYLDRYHSYLDIEHVRSFETLLNNSVFERLEMALAMTSRSSLDTPAEMGSFMVTQMFISFEDQPAMFEQFLKELSDVCCIVDSARNSSLLFTQNWTENVSPRIGSELS